MSDKEDSTQSDNYVPEFMKPESEQKDAEPLDIIEHEDTDFFSDPEEGKRGKKRGEKWGGSLVKADDTTWGDHNLADTEELRFKYETIAHMAASGMSQRKMAQDLGATDGTISIILSKTKVKERVHALQEKYWGGNIEKRFKQAMPKAMDVVNEAIDNTNGQFKPKERLDASIWLLEKMTGKAKQEIDHKGISIGELFTKVDDMLRKGEVIDITPKVASDHIPTEEETQQEKSDAGFDNWINQNLKDKI